MEGDWRGYFTAEGRVYFSSGALQQSSWERPTLKSITAAPEESTPFKLVKVGDEVVAVYCLESGEVTGMKRFSVATGDLVEDGQPLFPRSIGGEDGVRATFRDACALEHEGKALLVCAVNCLDVATNISSDKLFVSHLGDATVHCHQLAPYRGPLLTAQNGMLYIGSQQGVVEVFDVMNQGMEAPVKRLCMGENLAAGMGSSLMAAGDFLSLSGIGVSFISTYGNTVLTGDINGTIRFIEKQRLCFPPLGVDCGKKYQGEISGMGVIGDYLFVAKKDSVFVYRWSQMHTLMDNCLGRVPPKPVCQFSLGSDLASDITSLVCTDYGVFTGQKDGTVASWGLPTKEQEEYEYEYEDGEEEDLPGPTERFLALNEGRTRLTAAGSCVWACGRDPAAKVFLGLCPSAPN